MIEQDEAPHLESKPDKPEICGLTTRAVDMYTDRNSLMQDIITKENTLYATKQAYESLKKDLRLAVTPALCENSILCWLNSD